MELIDTPVIDMHSHVGTMGSSWIGDDPDRYVSILDAAGVDMAFVSNIFDGDHSIGNDTTAAFVANNPDRLRGVGFVTPHYPEECIQELERCFDVLGMQFLKVYPDYFRKPIDDPAYFPIFEWCNERGVVIKSHSSYTSESDQLTAPRKFVALAQKYSKTKWVLAHSGNTPMGQKEAIEAAQACPNIYLETATSYGDHGTVEYLVEGAGPDRVLYGSDIPLMDARLGVGRIVTAQLDDETKRKVLGLNAIELLGLEL